MKKYIGLLIMSILSGLVFWSCGSDDGSSEPTNQLPTCTVASPSPYSGFFKGDTISVKVNVNDQDGDIKEVRYFLDGIGEYSTITFPYSADIATQDLQLGGHLIKIVAEDDAGAESEVELPFGIKPQNPTNLQISQNNVYTFTLNWTSNDANADGFKIERKIDNDPFVEIKTTTVTTFIDSTVAKKGLGTVYYQLRAYKDIYNSDYASNSFAIAFPSPSNLTYTKLNLNTIRLNWIDSSTGEDGFRIDKKIGNNDWIISFGSVNENAVNWTDSLAEINETLQYRVYAYKGLNTSGSIETASFSNQFPTPTNLNIVQSSITTATISFTDNSKGEDKFQIERKLSTEDSYTLIKEILGSDTSSKTWIDSTTTPNLTYDYRVKGVKGSFASSYITKTGYNNLFNAPTSFTIVQNNVYTFTLNWSDSNIGEDGFKIERKIDDGVFSEIATTTQTNYIDNTVAKKGFGTVYYQIRAYKNTYFTNYTSNSSSVSFPAPTNLTFTKVSISSIRLNWVDNSTGEDGFIIDKKIGAAEWVNGFASVGANIVTWTDNNAEINQSLTYRIHAYKGTNTSAIFTSSVIDNIIPAPSNLVVTQTSITSASLTWSDNSLGEEKFDIERKLSTDSTYFKVAEVLGNDSATKNWNDTNLIQDLTYDYRIKAVKDLNTSIYIIMTGYYSEFQAPSALTTSFDSETSIKLDWTDNSTGEEGFKIHRKSGAGGTWVANYATVNENIKTFIDTGLTSGTTYYYQVRAYYSDYYSNYSNVSADTPGIEGFIEIPTGSFSMGSTTGGTDEVPVHTVNITRAFYLGKYEATQLEWFTTMGSNPSNYPEVLNGPVETVSWYSLLVYCNKRSIVEGITPCYTINGSTDPSVWGSVPTSSNSTWDAVTCNFSAKGYRLPTEAEWEYSASYNDGRTYPWGETVPTSTLCNFNSNVGSTTTVGAYPSGNNNLGLCDMAGNVWERVWDWYDTYPSTTQTNPTGPSTTLTYRVLRGGSWNNTVSFIRCADRFSRSLTIIDRIIGFRLARTK